VARFDSNACMTAPASLLLFLASAINADSGGMPEQPVQAIWRVEHVELTYTSAHVHYTCGALERKIRGILQALGAHQRMSVQLDCSGGRELVRSAYARVTLAMPAAATEENVQAATTFDARAQLIARVQKKQLPTPDDIEIFPAAWQRVALFRKRALGLDAGDCDLLRDMREQVFPKLALRVMGAFACMTGSATRIRPTLEVSALMPLPTPDGSAQTRG
jgi:hypothetical protein